MGCFVLEEARNKNVTNLGEALEFNNEVFLMFSIKNCHG